MADELTNSRAVLQRQHRDAQGALQDLLSEREQLRQGMKATHTYGPFTSGLFSAPTVPSMWKLYANKSNSLNEMDKRLKMHKLPKSIKNG